jgi:tRNA (cmo5U34)-methyltransferase
MGETTRDAIYRNPDEAGAPFEFNARVAEVFPDMIRRSVPGYARTLEEIRRLAGHVVRPGSVCYDLGCSLGAATLAMRHGIACDDAGIVAVDNSPAMIDKCRELIAADGSPVPVEIRLGDLRETPVADASLVVLNYTLQFVPPPDRSALLRRLRSGMNDGAVLVLSEKVRFADPVLDALFVRLHHDFKRDNAYSELEISRKRAALEDVLIPDTSETHLQRLRQAGFRHAACWMQELNFASFVAVV